MKPSGKLLPRILGAIMPVILPAIVVGLLAAPFLHQAWWLTALEAAGAGAVLSFFSSPFKKAAFKTTIGLTLSYLPACALSSLAHHAPEAVPYLPWGLGGYANQLPPLPTWAQIAYEHSTMALLLVFAEWAMVFRRVRSWMTFLSGFIILSAIFGGVLGLVPALAGAVYGLLSGQAVLHTAIVGYKIGAFLVTWRLAWWYKEGFKEVRNPGHYAPYPWYVERIIYRWIVARLVDISLGGKLVEGVDAVTANRFEGALQMGTNHQSGLDFLQIRLVFPFSFRQITTQLAVAEWLFSGLGAFGGAFAVASDGGKQKENGPDVVESCAAMLADVRPPRRVLGRIHDWFFRLVSALFSDKLWLFKFRRKNCKKNGVVMNKLLLYPQGKLVYDNIQRPHDYRTGAPRMCIRAKQLRPGIRAGMLSGATYYWVEPLNPSKLFDVNAPRKRAARARMIVASAWVKSNYADRPPFGFTTEVNPIIEIEGDTPNPRELIELDRQYIERALIIAKLRTYGIRREIACAFVGRVTDENGKQSYKRREVLERAMERYSGVQEAAMWEATIDDLVNAGFTPQEARVVKYIWPCEELDDVALAVLGPNLRKAKKLVAKGITADVFKPVLEHPVYAEALKTAKECNKALAVLTAEDYVTAGLTQEQAAIVKEVYPSRD